MYDPHQSPEKAKAMGNVTTTSGSVPANPIVNAHAVHSSPIAAVGTVAAPPQHQQGFHTPLARPAQAHNQQQAVITHPRPQPNKWADSICDWPNNIFPSCFCVCCVCYGMWLNAQMAQKTGCASFQVVIWTMVGVWFVSFILAIIFGGGFALWVPMIFAFLFAIFLRLHIVRREHITECGEGIPGLIGEFCCGFWCWYCSVAQMARHLYGYMKVLDGDGDPDRPDNYAPLEVAEQQV